MSSIEFGLLLPAMPGRGMIREIYLKRIREGLDMVTGHFHSLWYVEHVPFQDAPILEGWTALTYMAACYPSFQFGHVVLAQSCCRDIYERNKFCCYSTTSSKSS